MGNVVLNDAKILGKFPPFCQTIHNAYSVSRFTDAGGNLFFAGDPRDETPDTFRQGRDRHNADPVLSD